MFERVVTVKTCKIKVLYFSKGNVVMWYNFLLETLTPGPSQEHKLMIFSSGNTYLYSMSVGSMKHKIEK